MRIINKALRRAFTQPGPCEYCRKWCARREGHHLLSKGMGGANTFDIPINLIALGASKPYPLCLCHGDVTDGRIDNSEMVSLVAQRENTRADCIEAVMTVLCRMPKYPSDALIDMELAAMEGGARELGERVFGEWRMRASA